MDKRCPHCGESLDPSQWRHFADHDQRTTWSMKKNNLAGEYSPPTGVVEVTMQEQADLRFLQNYGFKLYT